MVYGVIHIDMITRERDRIRVMSLRSGPVSKANRPKDSAPPSGGEAGGTPPAQGGEGGSGGTPPVKTAAHAPLRWYVCKRCGSSVLSFKRTRAIHNKKCPPYVDKNLQFDSVIDSLLL